MGNYQKFIKHFNQGGIFYALWRGFKYFIFIIKGCIDNIRLAKKTIISGKVKIICTGCGVKIYWNDIELTKGVGLHCVLSSSRKWRDSAKAKWRVIKKQDSLIVIQSRWHNLPLKQSWKIEIKNQNLITWGIELEVEKPISIEQQRIIIFLSEHYKRWFNSYEEGGFSRIMAWQPAIFTNYSSYCIGVRSYKNESFFPSVLFDFSKNNLKVVPVILNASEEINARCLEAKIVFDEKNKRFLPGRYKFFYGEISLLEENILDKKIETFRNNLLEEFKSSLAIKKERHIRVLLANLPWQKNGRWGVRAGSRWPHIKDIMEKDYLPFPFFLAYATGLLRKNNIEAYFIDAIAQKLSEKDFLQMLNDISPDLLVAEISTPSLEHDLNFLKKINNRDISIVLCGPDVTIRNPEFLKENTFIDYILVGEYEYSLLDLVQYLKKNKKLDAVLGLIYRDNDEIMINSPRPLMVLNTLPWPLREELPMDKYIDNPGNMPLPSVQMLASRGCPFGCKFCLWPQVMYQGRNYRARNIKDVVDEMEYLIKDMGFKSVYFDDDTFNIGKDRMLQFCREIKKRNLQNIPWAIMARADLMDGEILKEMRSAGLWAVKYGVESFVQELVDTIGKNIDIKESIEMIKFTKALGIKTHLTFTFGLPDETKETIQRTIDTCLELDPDSVQFSITTPFPGTEYFTDLDKNGLIQSKKWSDYDGNHCSVISTKNLTATQLEEAREYAYKIWREHVWKRNFKTFGLVDYWRKFEWSYRHIGTGHALYKAFLIILFRYKNIILGIVDGSKKSLIQEGLLKTLQKVINRLNFYDIRNDYLRVLGTLDNYHAYIGPYCVQIDLTNNCNNDCIGCWCRSPFLSEDMKKKRLQESAQILPFNLVKNLIDELSDFGTREIFFSGGGEPFLHPDLLKITRYAKKKKMRCHINTNFTLLNNETVEELIKSKVDYLTVSLWAGTAKTYAATHPNKSETDFYKIWDILKLLNIKKSHLTPYVKIYNVMNKLNYHELEMMLDLAVKTGSEAVEFAVIDTIPDGIDKLSLSENERCEILRQCEHIEEKYPGHNLNNGFKIINLKHFMRRLSDSGADRSEYDSEFIDTIPCYVGWVFARILANGEVNSCLKSHRFPIGNIYKHSFREIWNSEHQIEFRQKTSGLNKDESFFSLIGNDPNCRIGCYKSCDNLGQNINMYNRINNLSMPDKIIINMLSKIYKPHNNGRKS